MWTDIFKIFRRKKQDKAAMKTFDIIVFSPGADGKTHQKHESGVKADSEKELIDLYAMTGEKIQIIRSYVDPADEAKNRTMEAARAKAKAGMPSDPSKPVPAAVVKKPEAKEKPAEQPKLPLKFFKVGSIECKLEDGKVYQRQWMRLTDKEMSSYRLISDSSNKIVSMNGKHLEAMKWVLAESDNEDESSAPVDAEIDNG